MIRWTELQSGTVIGFQGRGCISNTIRWCSTATILELSPDAPSHVGQVFWSGDGKTLWLNESTACTTKVPCKQCGEIAGVHVREFSDRLEEAARAGFRVFAYLWVWPPSIDSLVAMEGWWEANHGRGYDYWGAYDARLRGAGRLLRLGLWKRIGNRALNGRWFCNEACIASLQAGGLWPNDDNPSRWNPATMVTRLLREGAVRQVAVWDPWDKYRSGSAA